MPSWLRAIVCLVAISSVPLVWARIQPPWWDSPEDIQEMVDNQHDKIGNEGVDEYVPTIAGVEDRYRGAGINKIALPGSRRAAVEIARVAGRRKIQHTIRSDRIDRLGNDAVLKHAFGLTTRYGHLSSYAVKPGQQVARGDVIGYVGSTGRSTGAHLHYEILVNGKLVNPLQLLTEPPQ